MKIRRFYEYSDTEGLAIDQPFTHYHCEDCKASYKSFGQRSDLCRFCASHNVDIVSEEEYLLLIKDVVDDERWKEEMETPDKNKSGEKKLKIINPGPIHREYTPQPIPAK